jgi:hypothetical protein
MTDFLSHKLVEGNGIPKTAVSGVRSCGEEAVIRRMSTIHVWVPHPAANRKILAVRCQRLQIGGEAVSATDTFACRKEKFGKQTQVIADRKNPPGTGNRVVGSGECREHRF